MDSRHPALPQHLAGPARSAAGFGSPGPSDLDPRRAWQMLRRNWLILFACLAVSITAGFAALSRMPREYEATAALRMNEQGFDAPGLDDLTRAPRQTLGKTKVSTEMEVLRSRLLAEEVVDSLGLQLEVVRPERVPRSRIVTEARVASGDDAETLELALNRQGTRSFQVTAGRTDGAAGRPGPLAEIEALLARVALSFRGDPTEEGGSGAAESAETATARAAEREPVAVLGSVEPGSWAALGPVRIQLAPTARDYSEIRLAVLPRGDAVDALLENLQVRRASAEADVARLRYRARDPEVAPEVLNVLVTRYLVQRRAMQHRGPQGAASLIRAQLKTVNSRLRAAEDSLRAFGESRQVIDLPTQASSQVTQYADLRRQRDEVASERIALTRMLAEVRGGPQQAAGEIPAYRRLLAFPTLLRTGPAEILLQQLTAAERERTDLLSQRTADHPDVQALTDRIEELEGQVESLVVTYLDALSQQGAALDRTLTTYSSEMRSVPAKNVQATRFERTTSVLSSIANSLEVRLKEAELAEAVEDPGVQVLEWAVSPKVPVSPRPKLILAVAVLVGLTLGAGLAFGREWVDATVHTREDVLLITGRPAVGLIPHFRRIDRPRHLLQARHRSNRHSARRSLTRRPQRRQPVLAGLARGPAAEAYRNLRTHLRAAQSERQSRRLVLTSPSVGDGKTTSLSNLGVLLAQQGLHVLLMDADLRRGRLHTIFGAPREPGLSDVLEGRVTTYDAIQGIKPLAGWSALPDTPGEDIGVGPDAAGLQAEGETSQQVDLQEEVNGRGTLSLLTTGSIPRNPSELLGSSEAGRLLRRLEQIYDVILIDTPPVGLFADALVLGAGSAGIILVARAGKTQRQELADAVQRLENGRVPLQGIVLNDFDVKREPHYAKIYQQYSYYAGSSQ